MKSQGPGATDDTADPTGSAAVSRPGGSGPSARGAGNGTSGRTRAGTTGGNRSRAGAKGGGGATSASADDVILPPEPAGDAPGPVVDGRSPEEVAASPVASSRVPGPIRTSRGKRKKARPAAPDPGPEAEGGGGTVQPAGPDPISVKAAAAPPGGPPTTAGDASLHGAGPTKAAGTARGARPLDLGTAAASDPLAVPELVTLSRRGDADDPRPVPAERSEPAPDVDRGRAPNPAVATLAFLRGTRRTMIRSRKVRRVIRHVDPWSVLTFSVIFHLCLFGALLLAGTLVWSAASASGTIDNVESFVRDLGDYETWEIQGDAVLRAGFIAAGMLTLASTIMVVLLTVVFNLISDLVGGIRVTVIEEEVHQGPIPAGSAEATGGTGATSHEHRPGTPSGAPAGPPEA